MKNVKKLAIAGTVAALALAPFLAFAQPPSIAPSPTVAGPITSTQSIINLINRILFWVATVFWIAAAAFVFYAAFLYLTAAGDEEKVKKASHQLLYAVVAIAVGIMAYGLPVLVGAFLQGQ
jgi:hypothetical protein